MIDFPANPSEGETFLANGVVYTFTGGAWVATGGTPPADIFVLRAGDIMGGPLEVPNTEPSGDWTVVPKIYADRRGGVVTLVRGSQNSIPANALTVVTWSTAMINDAGAWVSTAAGRLTVPAWAKRVRLTANCEWGAVQSGSRVLMISKNSTALVRDDRTGTSLSGQSLSVLDTCVGGDFYQVQVFHDVPGGLNLNGGTPTRFGAEFFA